MALHFKLIFFFFGHAQLLNHLWHILLMFSRFMLIIIQFSLLLLKQFFHNYKLLGHFIILMFNLAFLFDSYVLFKYSLFSIHVSFIKFSCDFLVFLLQYSNYSLFNLTINSILKMICKLLILKLPMLRSVMLETFCLSTLSPHIWRLFIMRIIRGSRLLLLNITEFVKRISSRNVINLLPAIQIYRW
jgi:hypothetical protein